MSRGPSGRLPPAPILIRLLLPPWRPDAEPVALPPAHLKSFPRTPESFAAELAAAATTLPIAVVGHPSAPLAEAVLNAPAMRGHLTRALNAAYARLILYGERP